MIGEKSPLHSQPGHECKRLFATSIAAVHLPSYIVGVKLFGVLLLVVGSLCAQTDRAGLDEGFDQPVKTTVVDLGPSPYHRPTLHVRKS